jgi:RimJ/RimL family protein N-acetyltransferase
VKSFASHGHEHGEGVEPEIISLETERLCLRSFAESDLDEYARICADPEVMRYLGGKTFSRYEAWNHMAAILGHWRLRGYGMWAVQEKSSGALLGRIGFYNPEGWPGFELGWVLGRSYWGRGFATEGARAALEYGLSVLRQPHVISLIRPENKASIRVAERLGESLEGKTPLLGNEVFVYGISRPGS